MEKLKLSRFEILNPFQSSNLIKIYSNELLVEDWTKAKYVHILIKIWTKIWKMISSKNSFRTFLEMEYIGITVLDHHEEWFYWCICLGCSWTNNRLEQLFLTILNMWYIRTNFWDTFEHVTYRIWKKEISYRSDYY